MTKKSLGGAFVTLLAAAIALLAYGMALFPFIHGMTTTSTSVAVEDGTRIDGATGIAFPSTQKFQVDKKRNDMTLLGVGTRKKAIINVYSVGLYGSPSVVKAITGKGQGSDEVCTAVLEAKGTKAALLTFAMGVGGEKMADAISNIPGPEQSVKDAFHDMIVAGIGGKINKGESMTFEWKGSGGGGEMVEVTVRGTKIGETKDKTFARALLEVYLGPKSVSPSLKKNMGIASDE